MVSWQSEFDHADGDYRREEAIMIPRLLAVLLTALLLSPALAADSSYKPFVLASTSEAGLAQQAETTVNALEGAGFSVAGRYSPVPNAQVIVVTSPELQAVAAQSDKGGYAAGQRVSITERDGKTEVAFVNPLYIQYAYRLEGDLQGVYDQLSSVLGNIAAFGSEKGLTAKKLGKYHYMMAMPYFDDPYELGSFPSYEAALAAVEKGLAREGDALTQVYRIDVPGKQQSVFGVAMQATGQSDDEVDIDATHQLSIVDFEGYSKVAYFPYELLVNGNEIEALHMRFRMAVHFPDLSMMGEHGFTKLLPAPPATKDALEAMLQAE
jgi:hypothetical protein